MFSTLDISTSALVAQRINLDTIAGNITNMHTTRTPDGEPIPYQRRVALFASGDAARGPDAPGVHAKVVHDTSPPKLVHDPDHPDAIQDGPLAGYLQMPNVDYSTELINAMVASRMYEANITVMEITKTMAAASLRLLA